MASEQRPELRPLRISRSIGEGVESFRVPLMPLAVPERPVAPDRGDQGASLDVPDTRTDMSRAFADLERAYAGVLTHKAECGVNDRIQMCTCGLDQLNMYLGRTP